MFHRRQSPHQPPQPRAEMIDILTGDRDQLHACAMGRQIIQRDIAGAFRLPCPIDTLHLAFGQQRTQQPVSRPVLRIGQERLARDQLHPTPDHGAHLRLGRFGMQAHDPRHRIQICTPQRIIPQRPSGCGQINRIRRPPQKRKTGGQSQFDKRRAGVGGEVTFAQGPPGVLVVIFGHQANIPCTNHRGSPPRPSSCRPSRYSQSRRPD